jgi:signal transduction histidine kinase
MLVSRAVIEPSIISIITGASPQLEQNFLSNNKTSSAVRLFGDLKVRPKLMVLHNLFFLVLTCAVYFSIIPLFEKQVADAQARELTILHQTDTSGQGLTAPRESYAEAAARARLTLFLVLGSIYVLAVLVLESAIMPLYVYRPLQRMLDADAATQKGDRDREMIPPSEILTDEIGQIMRSRNETVAALRRQEDELAAALRRIEEQDRLVSLGLLSASVAHELNTPLAVLNGSIEKLIETTEDQPTLERLARMQRVAQRLQKISESLVDFSRVRHQSMGPLLIRPLIEEAWGLVAIDDKSSAVEFADHVADEKVIGNPDRLVQVFVNLLRNALNAVEAGSGKIDVRSRPGPRGITIAVEDNGRGIAPDVLPDIFDAFVSTRLDARGTGLGLTVAEGIVRQHGGTISASNRKEGGARLEVTLPAAARD